MSRAHGVARSWRRALRARRHDRAALLLSALLTAALSLALPELTAQPSAPSSQAAVIIYSHAPRAIRFDHLAHAETPCDSCHQGVAESERAESAHRPGMAQCVSCHADDATPRLEECAGCHLHYSPEITGLIESPEQWRAVSPPPMIPPQPQPALRFAHSKHADEGCSSCHEMKSNERPSMPPMKACTTCHDGATASAACATCHLEGQLSRLKPRDELAATGRPPERVPLPPPPSSLTAPLQQAPRSHELDWLNRHGVIALIEREDCMSCHTETSCASCHNTSSPVPLAAHPPNYLVEHRHAARLDPQECTDCHRQEATCIDCHTSMRVAPPGAMSDGPPPSLAFHPAGWLDASDPEHHGVMAKRHINECASCHQERDCIACHQGVSPHPDDFLATCSRVLQRNRSACVKCHDAELQTLCP